MSQEGRDSSSERSATKHNHLNSTAHCTTLYSQPGSETSAKVLQLLDQPAGMGDRYVIVAAVDMP